MLETRKANAWIIGAFCFGTLAAPTTTGFMSYGAGSEILGDPAGLLRLIPVPIPAYENPCGIDGSVCAAFETASCVNDGSGYCEQPVGEYDSPRATIYYCPDPYCVWNGLTYSQTHGSVDVKLGAALICNSEELDRCGDPNNMVTWKGWCDFWNGALTSPCHSGKYRRGYNTLIGTGLDKADSYAVGWKVEMSEA